MRILAIDVGNTRIKAGLFEKTALVEKHAVSTRRVSDSRALGSWLMETVSDTPQTIFVASVVRGCGDLIRDAVASTGKNVVEATPSMAIGVTADVSHPERVGIDRLVAAGEAYARTQAATVLVTVGTAITIDFVTGDGRFVGGTISPGLWLAAGSLHAETSLLPDVEPGPPSSVPPATTEDSIRAGLMFGASGTIEKIVSQAWGGAGARRILTGGDAACLLPYLDGDYDVMEDLVLYGLASTWVREGAREAD